MNKYSLNCNMQFCSKTKVIQTTSVNLVPLLSTSQLRYMLACAQLSYCLYHSGSNRGGFFCIPFYIQWKLTNIKLIEMFLWSWSPYDWSSPSISCTSPFCCSSPPANTQQDIKMYKRIHFKNNNKQHIRTWIWWSNIM